MNTVIAKNVNGTHLHKKITIPRLEVEGKLLLVSHYKGTGFRTALLVDVGGGVQKRLEVTPDTEVRVR